MCKYLDLLGASFDEYDRQEPSSQGHGQGDSAADDEFWRARGSVEIMNGQKTWRECLAKVA